MLFCVCVGASVLQVTPGSTVRWILTIVKIISVKTGLSVLMLWMATHVCAQKDTGEHEYTNTLQSPGTDHQRSPCGIHVSLCFCVYVCSGLFCEFSPPMVLPRTSPCDHYDCANGAQCVVKDTDPVCQCLHGYEGVHCERLVSVNFINRESFLQIPSNLITEQANISLQVHVIKRSSCLCFLCDFKCVRAIHSSSKMHIHTLMWSICV